MLKAVQDFQLSFDLGLVFAVLLIALYRNFVINIKKNWIQRIGRPMKPVNSQDQNNKGN